VVPAVVHVAAMRDAPRQPPRVQQRERGVARGSRVGMTFVIKPRTFKQQLQKSKARSRYARLRRLRRDVGDEGTRRRRVC
jgi:hypothetical protein